MCEERQGLNIVNTSISAINYQPANQSLSCPGPKSHKRLPIRGKRQIVTFADRTVRRKSDNASRLNSSEIEGDAQDGEYFTNCWFISSSIHLLMYLDKQINYVENHSIICCVIRQQTRWARGRQDYSAQQKWIRLFIFLCNLFILLAMVVNGPPIRLLYMCLLKDFVNWVNWLNRMNRVYCCRVEYQRVPLSPQGGNLFVDTRGETQHFFLTFGLN